MVAFVLVGCVFRFGGLDSLGGFGFGRFPGVGTGFCWCFVGGFCVFVAVW